MGVDREEERAERDKDKGKAIVPDAAGREEEGKEGGGKEGRRVCFDSCFFFFFLFFCLRRVFEGRSVLLLDETVLEEDKGGGEGLSTVDGKDDGGLKVARLSRVKLVILKLCEDALDVVGGGALEDGGTLGLVCLEVVEDALHVSLDVDHVLLLGELCLLESCRVNDVVDLHVGGIVDLSLLSGDVGTVV